MFTDVSQIFCYFQRLPFQLPPSFEHENEIKHDQRTNPRNVLLDHQMHTERKFALPMSDRGVPERFDTKPVPVRCIGGIPSRNPRLKVVKTEVGPVDGELVCEEVARDYEQEQGEDDGRACSQLELGLEGGDES